MIADLCDLKAAADAAFMDGRLEESAALYSELLSFDPSNAAALCNHSAVVLKSGHAEDALRSADRALELLTAQAFQGEEGRLPQLAKAYHRKAQAWVALGSVVTAVQVYRRGLRACPGCEGELLAALRITADLLPPAWLAKYWARLIEEAQAPNPLSSRDGRLLKTIPPERRLAPGDLRAQLEAALLELQDEARDLMCAAWARGRKPGRAEVAFVRAAAYLQAGNAEVALRDVRLALVYGPQASVAGPASSSQALVATSKGKGGSGAAGPPAPPPVVQVPCWPAALALQSGALEALADNVPAALSMAKAAELEPENQGYAQSLERLLRRIPEEQAAALRERGSAGLEAFLAAEREQRIPEFLRRRPKYYYYYEWMRKRINEQYPQLPEPVMDKLLTIEANELDLILQYPQATQQTVERVLDVYCEHGEQYLETYRVPLLTWEEVKALKGPGTIGLPLGSEAYGGLLEGLGMAQKPPPALLEGEGGSAAQVAGAAGLAALPPPSQPSAPAAACAETAQGPTESGERLQKAGQASEEERQTKAALPAAPVAVGADDGGWASVVAADSGLPSSLRSHEFDMGPGEEDARSDGSASVEEFSDLYELD